MTRGSNLEYQAKEMLVLGAEVYMADKVKFEVDKYIITSCKYIGDDGDILYECKNDEKGTMLFSLHNHVHDTVHFGHSYALRDLTKELQKIIASHRSILNKLKN